MENADIARVCHQVNKALCEAFGDKSQVDWGSAPDWQRQSAINGVQFSITNPGASEAAQHESWLEEKRQQGWAYGPVKDAEAKLTLASFPMRSCLRSSGRRITSSRLS